MVIKDVNGNENGIMSGIVERIVAVQVYNKTDGIFEIPAEEVDPVNLAYLESLRRERPKNSEVRSE